MEFFAVYVSMLVIYVIVDFIWITLFMQPYFTANLGHLLRESVGLSFLITYGSIFSLFHFNTVITYMQKLCKFSNYNFWPNGARCRT